MKPILSCEFYVDTACVELKFLDGTMLAIDTIAVEDKVAANRFERSELDYLMADHSSLVEIIKKKKPSEKESFFPKIIFNYIELGL